MRLGNRDGQRQIRREKGDIQIFSCGQVRSVMGLRHASDCAGICRRRVLPRHELRQRPLASFPRRSGLRGLSGAVGAFRPMAFHEAAGVVPYAEPFSHGPLAARRWGLGPLDAVAVNQSCAAPPQATRHQLNVAFSSRRLGNQTSFGPPPCFRGPRRPENERVRAAVLQADSPMHTCGPGVIFTASGLKGKAALTKDFWEHCGTASVEYSGRREGRRD